MHRLVFWIGVVIATTGVCGSARGQALPSVEEVTDHLDDLYRSSSSYAVMTMIVVRERGTRELIAESWSRGVDESLIVIRSPLARPEPQRCGPATGCGTTPRAPTG